MADIKDIKDQISNMNTGNIFVAVAMLLYRFNKALEESAKEGKLPRWVRIGRAREYQKDAVGGAVCKAMGSGVLPGVAYMHRFTLQAYNILNQLDSMKALGESGGAVAKTIVEPAKDGKESFVGMITKAVGVKEKVEVPKEVSEVLDIVLSLMNLVPDPESLDVISHELYKMLCVVHAPDGTIDVQKTGKLRLLQWGLNAKVPLFYTDEKGDFKKVDEKEGICYFGIRDGDISAAPKLLEGSYKNTADKDSASVPLKIFEVEPGQLQDSAELEKMLAKLGYTDGSLPSRIEQFQKVNEINPKKVGSLDDSTINRLWNLDMDSMAEVPDLSRIIGDDKKDDTKDTVIDIEADSKKDIKTQPKKKVTGFIKLAKRNPVPQKTS